MTKYRVCQTPVAELTPDDIRTEANALRAHMARARGDISSRKSWADAEDRKDAKDHKKWLANARTFLAKLETRYAEVRAAERELNRHERNARSTGSE
jgi:hypothetical protein